MRRMLYAGLGGLAGLSLGLIGDLVLKRFGPVLPGPWAGLLVWLVRDGGLWLIGGSALALLWPSPEQTGRSNSCHRQEQTAVAMSPARCGWCGGQGRAWGLLRLRCGVCDGQGHVLAVQPRRRCAFCQGRGVRWLLFRCPACHGGGWLTRKPGR